MDARAEPGEQLDGVAALRKRESLGLLVIQWGRGRVGWFEAAQAEGDREGWRLKFGCFWKM